MGTPVLEMEDGETDGEWVEGGKVGISPGSWDYFAQQNIRRFRVY